MCDTSSSAGPRARLDRSVWMVADGPRVIPTWLTSNLIQAVQWLRLICDSVGGRPVADNAAAQLVSWLSISLRYLLAGHISGPIKAAPLVCDLFGRVAGHRVSHLTAHACRHLASLGPALGEHFCLLKSVLIYLAHLFAAAAAAAARWPLSSHLRPPARSCRALFVPALGPTN